MILRFCSIASLVTHMSATAWAGFQIWSTSAFHNDFRRIATNGACQINLLPSYWKDRANAEIPSLVLNTVALLVSAFLSWRLIKVFPIQVFFFVAQADLSFAVIRLADFQAHRGFFEHQPHLQAHSDAFYRHPVVTVLHRRVDRYLARPNLQWYFCPPIN